MKEGIQKGRPAAAPFCLYQSIKRNSEIEKDLLEDMQKKVCNGQD
jgi:hypothetical protein